MLNLYSVFDDVAKSFGQPFPESSDATAARGFHYACKNENSFLFVSPQDFSLWRVGEFNEKTGEFTSYKEKVVDGIDNAE